MELTDRFTVRATPQQTWELLFDLPRVARCLPGCDDIRSLDETTYRAHMTQRVGPFQVAMDIDLKVGEIADGQRVVVAGGGKDRMGNTMQLDRLAMELRPVSAVETEISYMVDFKLFGRIATLGSAMVKRKAQETIAEFTRRIIAELETPAS